MEVQNLVQGSPEWHAHRAAHDNASDAPVVMGVSSYKKREQLIAERATGVTPEVGAATQRLFDSGHRFEALARPRAEEIIGDDLYPVTGSLGRRSASFDGLTMDKDVAYEHKRLNQRLRAALSTPGCTGADLPDEYQIQMEQQCEVSGCKKVLFMASSWSDDGAMLEEMHCWYYPNLDLRARIVAGWEQFHKDVAAYRPAAAAPAAPVVAEPVESLPAVNLRLDGQLVVASNLPDFAVALRAYIERIPKAPETDQEFANADAACKALKKAEEALDSGEEHALAQLTDVEQMRRTVKDLRELARTTRLTTEKLVATRKEQIRGEIVAGGIAAFRDHIAALNARLGKPYMPTVPADFNGVIKGKRTVDSLRGAVNDELARAKIAANEIADRIQLNLNTLREQATAHAFLFADAPSLVMKANDDLQVLIKSRIGDHQAAEEKRLEAERARIREEEQTRAENEARAKLLAQAKETQQALDEARQEESFPEPLLNDLSNLVKDMTNDAVASLDADQVIRSAKRAAANPAADSDSATLLIGGINRRLGYDVNALFLKQLGFEPVRIDGARQFYRDSDLPLIGRAIAQHTLRVTQLQPT